MLSVKADHLTAVEENLTLLVLAFVTALPTVNGNAVDVT